MKNHDEGPRPLAPLPGEQRQQYIERITALGTVSADSIHNIADIEFPEKEEEIESAPENLELSEAEQAALSELDAQQRNSSGEKGELDEAE